MKNSKVYVVLRSILGAALLFFGLNGLFQFSEVPPFPENAQNLLSALFVSGYIMQTVSAVMTLVGILFLSNKYASLAAVILFPLSLNFILFHIFLDIKSIPGALVVFALNIYILWFNKEKFEPLLTK